MGLNTQMPPKLSVAVQFQPWVASSMQQQQKVTYTTPPVFKRPEAAH